MRAFAFLSAISLALAAPAYGQPRRVASLNLCTDEQLLLLAVPEQIVSVTHLAQEPAETPLWAAARRHARNDGSLVSVAALRPDLVLTMGGGARDRGRIAERLGMNVLDLPFAASLDDVAASIRRLAAALGREERGAFVLRGLAALRASAPHASRDAIWLGGGGRTVMAGGLEAQWMALAGLGQRAMQGDRVGLETLIARPPAVLLRSDYRQGQYSSGQRWLTHPAARRARAGRTIATDGRLWTCMGPLLIGEVLRLRRELAR
ncbi:ABC transporter substrate-binding protein [Sphingosinicella sp.]|uniref:ABC transporter substrate-binding protein n=1 Tax=Sphingosinicella sp. TaxID=1917971 RepID=UPI00403780F2